MCGFPTGSEPASTSYKWVRAIDTGVKTWPRWVIPGAAVFEGRIWQMMDNAPWFPRSGQYSTVFDGKLRIYGGKTGTTYKRADDVWFMKAKLTLECGGLAPLWY